jgi:hypothetical protein
MALNLPNWSQSRAPHSVYDDLLGKLTEGYKAGRLPKQIRQEEAQKEQLISKLMKENEKLDIEMPFIRPEKELQHKINERKYEHPGLESGVPEAVLLELAELTKGAQSEGEMSETGKKYKDLSDRMIQKRIDDAIRTRQLIDFNEFNSLPGDAKDYVVGLGRSFGISPTQLMEGFSKGKTFGEQAKEKGYTDEDIATAEPSHTPTKSTINRAQRLNELAAERGVLAKYQKEAIAPFSNRVFGFSPKQIAKQISGGSKHEQAKFLAARSLAPETVGITFGMLGGTTGIKAIEAMKKASMADMEVFEAFIDPETYKLSQEYVDKWLTHARQEAQEVRFAANKHKPIEESRQEQAQETAKNIGPGYNPEKIIEQENEEGGTKATVRYRFGNKVTKPLNVAQAAKYLQTHPGAVLDKEYDLTRR